MARRWKRFYKSRRPKKKRIVEFKFNKRLMFLIKKFWSNNLKEELVKENVFSNLIRGNENDQGCTVNISEYVDFV